MDENFLQTTISPDLGNFGFFRHSIFLSKSCFHLGPLENSGNIYSFSNMSVLPSLAVTKTHDVSNAPEYQSFFNDSDFGFSRFSTMTRW